MIDDIGTKASISASPRNAQLLEGGMWCDERIRAQSGQRPVAGPPIVGGRGYETGTNGIEIDVSAGREQMTIGLDQAGAIAAFP